MLIKQLFKREMQNLFPLLQGLNIQLDNAKEIIFLAAPHAEMYLSRIS